MQNWTQFFYFSVKEIIAIDNTFSGTTEAMQKINFRDLEHVLTRYIFKNNLRK